MDPPVYAKAITTARKLFDFAESIGYHFTLLDIGGGFPGDKGTDIKEVCLHLTRYLRIKCFMSLHTFVFVPNDVCPNQRVFSF